MKEPGTLKVIYVTWLCAGVLALCSCSVQKFIPPGEYLYTGATVRVDAPDSSRTRVLERSLRNTVDARSGLRFFGPGFRTYMYYRYHAEASKGVFNKFMQWMTRSLNREPVYYSEDIPGRMTTALQNTATNHGYFQNDATFRKDTTLRGRGIQVNYRVEVKGEYRLDTLHYAIQDSAIAVIVDSLSDNTLIEEGDRYSLAILKQERRRIQESLRALGYYYFTGNDLEFLVDTAGIDRNVQLLLRLKDDTPHGHLIPYSIDSIIVFSDFNFLKDSMERSPDTLYYQGLTIICTLCPLKPKVLREAFAVSKDELYSPNEHRKTVGRLSSYNTFRYIGLSYQRMEHADSLLRMTAHLTPLLRRRIEGEVGAAYNSGSYFGPEAGLTYLNRNLLRGAELLRIDGDFTYAFFLRDPRETRIPRSGTYRLYATLNVPRLWLPKRNKLLSALRESGTVIQAGGNLESLRLSLRQFASRIAEEGYEELAAILERDSSAAPNVTLLQLIGQYGYSWQRHVTRRHSVFPLSVRYQNPVARSEQLLALSRSAGLARGDQNLGRLDRMLLFAPNYTFLYDTRLKKLRTHNFYFGSRLSLNFNHIYPVGENASVFDSEVSRYVQFEPDFRYYLIFNARQQIATRLHAGIALPLGTRAIVPYFDLYTVGGPNSVRGFIPRGIGPGRVVPEDNNLLTEGGYGNVLLEGSIELRQSLSSAFELAIFGDAGNVWTYKTSGEPLESDFSLQRLFGELGISLGVGIRYQFQSLILRLDLAKPVQLPYTTPAGEEADDSVKLVVGFGYPF